MSMRVELVSPERILWSGEAELVVARTVGGGDIAFLPDHAPFVGALGVAPLIIRPSEGGADIHVAVHGGFVEVSNNVVTVLSDVAELSEHIDLDRAQAAKSAAEAAIGGEGAEEVAEALRRAEVRINVAQGTVGVS